MFFDFNKDTHKVDVSNDDRVLVAHIQQENNGMWSLVNLEGEVLATLKTPDGIKRRARTMLS